MKKREFLFLPYLGYKNSNSNFIAILRDEINFANETFFVFTSLISIFPHFSPVFFLKIGTRAAKCQECFLHTYRFLIRVHENLETNFKSRDLYKIWTWACCIFCLPQARATNFSNNVASHLMKFTSKIEWLSMTGKYLNYRHCFGFGAVSST